MTLTIRNASHLSLRAEDINWDARTICFTCKKLKSRGTSVKPALFWFSADVEVFLKRLPAEGQLFPYRCTSRAGVRATEFTQRCVGLGITGIVASSATKGPNLGLAIAEFNHEPGRCCAHAQKQELWSWPGMFGDCRWARVPLAIIPWRTSSIAVKLPREMALVSEAAAQGHFGNVLLGEHQGMTGHAQT